MSDEDFTRRSETESICMYCFAKVRVTKHEPLESAERDDAFICMEWPTDLRITSA
jgi:hypothetical protein